MKKGASGRAELLKTASGLIGEWRVEEAVKLLDTVADEKWLGQERPTALRYLCLRLLCYYNLGQYREMAPYRGRLEEIVDALEQEEPLYLLGLFHLALTAPWHDEPQRTERLRESFIAAVMENLPSLDDNARRKNLMWSALLLTRSGENLRALSLLRRALALPGAASNTILLNNLIDVEMHAGEMEAALAHLEMLEKVFSESEPPPVARTGLLTRRATTALLGGQPAEAESALSAALELARSTGSRKSLQMTLLLLVFTAASRGQWKTVKNYLNVARETAGMAGEQQRLQALELVDLCYLGVDVETAERLRSEAEKKRDRGLQILACYALAAVHLRRGEEEAGREAVNEAVLLAAEWGFCGMLAEIACGAPEALALCEETLAPVLQAVRERSRFPVTVCTLGEQGVSYGERFASVGEFYSVSYFYLLVWLSRLKGRTVSKESAIEALWPGGDTQRSYGSLVNGISRVRKALRSIGVPLPKIRPRGAVSLGYPLRCDIDDLEEVVKAARAVAAVGDASGLYGRAVEMYVGPFLEGAGYHWVEDTRWYAFGLFRESALYLARRKAEDEAQKALSLYERVLAEDPLDEETVELACSLLDRLGRESEARRLRASYERRLKALSG